MSATTMSFKVFDHQKEFIYSILNDVADLYPGIDSRGDAIYKVFQIYSEKKPDSVEVLEPEIRKIIELINCPYLRYEGSETGYVCNEFFYKKKKGEPIGGNPELIMIRCSDCKKGKFDQRQLEIERTLRKDALTKIIKLYRSLSFLTSQGLTIKCYCCKFNYFTDGVLTFTRSKDLVLPCPIEDEETLETFVSVEDVCKNRINPDTLLSPCKHLVDLLIEGPPIEIDDLVKEFKESFPELTFEMEPEERDKKQIDSDIVEDEEK